MSTRVVFFPTGGMGDASARTRLYYYLPLLATRGIKAHVTSYSYHRNVVMPEAKRRWTWERLWLEVLAMRTLMRLLFADVVWFQKLSVRPWALHLAKLLGKRVVYDLDDAVYLKPPEGPGKSGHPIEVHDENRRIVENILTSARAVTVSGRSLAGFAGQFASDVTIIPTCVGQVAERPSTAPDPAVIVWVGAPENLRYLLAIEDVLLRLQKEFSGLVIRLITSRLQDTPRIRYEHIVWSLKAEAEWIPQSTVGIAPLADDDWCRAKMNYKALVYLSHGVPAIVTPGGFPLDRFTEEKSILVARSHEDWYRHLRRVIEQPDLRQQLASGGLDVLRTNFTAAANVESFTAALLGQD